jgi:hypothetical protein
MLRRSVLTRLTLVVSRPTAPPYGCSLKYAA